VVSFEDGDDTLPTENNYDGFYFAALNDSGEDTEEENNIMLQFFTFVDTFSKSKPVGHNELGYCYHLAFFKLTGEGVKFDGTFEAILVDPLTYIRNLVGSNLLGCIVRKTGKSSKWMKQYLAEAKIKAEQMSIVVDKAK